MSLVEENRGGFSILMQVRMECDGDTVVACVCVTCCGVLGSVAVGIAPGGSVKGLSAMCGGCEYE